MRGYWRNEQATNAMLKKGPDGLIQMHTGDLFRTDAEGFLYFVGRKDDIIKTRGEKVAPKEVEAVLHALPGVAEAVVAGIPDPILGQAVTAMVVLSNPALTEREVLAHCARNLEDFMVPKRIVLLTRCRAPIQARSAVVWPPENWSKPHEQDCNRPEAGRSLWPGNAEHRLRGRGREDRRGPAQPAARHAQARPGAGPFRRHRFQRLGCARRPRGRREECLHALHAGA